MLSSNGNISFPNWYKIERETGDTIQRLMDHKELAFYLENPDPFIRRLAILRTGQLKKKDSYSLLYGILDDEMETEENRELAALLMTNLNHELNLGFFSNNSYLSRFSGKENIDDLLKIAIIDTLPDISLNFKNALIESQLHFDNEFLKSSMDEKYDVMPFSMKAWISHVSSGIFFDMKKGLKHLTGLIIKALFIRGPKRLYSWFASIPNLITTKNNARKEHPNEKTPRKPRTRPVTYSRQRAKTFHLPLAIRIKGLLRCFVIFLFFPIRFIFRFKWAILISMIIIYGLVSFTVPGKSFLFRIDPKAYYLNNRFLREAEDLVISLVLSNKTLANVLGASQIPVPQKVAQIEKQNKLLVVIAPKGLYLRSEPQSGDNKLVLMKENTNVEFLGEEKKDASGGLWFKVRLDEDVAGWANARFLGEVTK